VNLILDGGPDFRHLIVPPFDAEPESYGYAYWSNRWRAHAIRQSLEAWQQRWEEDYFHLEAGRQRFGILKKAAWLRDEFEAGRVALVNNLFGARSRDHSHGLLVWESGDLETNPRDRGRDGWGGRLARVSQGGVVSMTSPVPLFCNGPHPTRPNWHDNRELITVQKIQTMGLYHAPRLQEQPSASGAREVMSRGLKSYYAAKGAEMDSSSPYWPIIQHEQALRRFGAQVAERLEVQPIPESLLSLSIGGGLKDRGFGQQLQNLYGAFSCADLFKLHVAALRYRGWDSHKHQKRSIEPQFKDLFGAGEGLSSFFDALRENMPEAAAQTLLLIGGEFGRQLQDNGDEGSDHGQGNMALVIGEPVQGGIYGQLFPEDEIPRYREPNQEIKGLTSIEALFAELADWVHPGAGEQLFPRRAEAPQEEGLQLSRLIS